MPVDGIERCRETFVLLPKLPDLNTYRGASGSGTRLGGSNDVRLISVASRDQHSANRRKVSETLNGAFLASFSAVRVIVWQRTIRSELSNRSQFSGVNRVVTHLSLEDRYAGKCAHAAVNQIRKTTR